MANHFDNGHRRARAYQAMPEHKLVAVVTTDAIFKAILLQKLAHTTEELVRLSERVKEHAKRGAGGQ
jgi:Ni,Fe-hydrogenase III small subunit